MSAIAASMLARAGGVSGQPALGSSGVSANAVVHRFTVAGVADATKFDQTMFYSLVADVALSTSHVLASPVPVGSPFFNASATWQYASLVPAPLTMIHLTDFNNTGNFSSGTMYFVRRTPSGNDSQEMQALSLYRTPDQVQLGTLSIPINGEPIDGYTGIRLVFPAGATANTYTASFKFGDTIDRRAGVPSASPEVVVSPRAR